MFINLKKTKTIIVKHRKIRYETNTVTYMKHVNCNLPAYIECFTHLYIMQYATVLQ